MKNQLFTVLFAVFASLLSAQTVQENFAAWADVNGTPTGSGPYVITIKNFAGNQRAFDMTWALTDLVAGDILWTGTCSRYIVVSRSGLAITVSDPDPGNAILPINNERITLIRETPVNGFGLAQVPQNGDGNAGAIAGTLSASAGCLAAHYQKQTQLAIAAGKEITYYAGTGAPAFTPVSGDPLLARNGVGEIYRWDGAAWVIIGGSTALATATANGLFPAYNSLELVTGATSAQARANATTATGLPFIWVDGGGAKSILIK